MTQHAPDTAAPDLLDAARNLLARTEGAGPDVDISALWDALRAAIAKAEGSK